MKSTNETNAREEMERIWRDAPVAVPLESRIEVLEAKVAELGRVLAEVLIETNR
jgi:uncharacterized protein YceH (UPF0502 family)